jgi:hypothetical protein
VVAVIVDRDELEFLIATAQHPPPVGLVIALLHLPERALQSLRVWIAEERELAARQAEASVLESRGGE